MVQDDQDSLLFKKFGCVYLWYSMESKSIMEVLYIFYSFISLCYNELRNFSITIVYWRVIIVYRWSIVHCNHFVVLQLSFCFLASLGFFPKENLSLILFIIENFWEHDFFFSFPNHHLFFPINCILGVTSNFHLYIT